MKLAFRPLFTALIALTVIFSAACGDDKTTPKTNDTQAGDTTDVDPDVAEPDAEVSDGGDTETVDPVGLEAPCDPLDPKQCLLPFPSNLYLVPDASRDTGFTLDFGNALVRNVDGKAIASAPYKRLDGYSVGTPLIVSFPDLDLAGLATEYDTAPSLAANAEILWFAVGADDTLTRVPYFVDDDVQELDLAERLLIVRPAAILDEGTRYIVAFRSLKNRDGSTYAPSAAFAALVAGNATDPALAPRQGHFDGIFGLLADNGVSLSGLQLAWDFTTASCDALHGMMLHMVDGAFAEVGQDGPQLTSIEVEELTNEDWALEIRGTFEVPHYMKESPMVRFDGIVWTFNQPGGVAKELPTLNGTRSARFWVRIPKSAFVEVDGARVPHGLVMYGHGQNGSGTQVRSGANGRIANQNNLIFFAADMWGMSEEDFAGILDMLGDMSNFTGISDRIQQGILNHVLLARSFKNRFASLDAVTSRGILIDPARFSYSGISQGGIYGASFVAVSPDLQRGHLGVPGNNYGFMLGRSRNFAPFFLGLAGFYQERWKQVVLLQVIQLLWDGGDPTSYMKHISKEPFPGQGANAFLLAPAKGDVQVAVTSNEWLARSGLGIPVMTPYDTTRTVPSGAETAAYPRNGSGIVLYDFGNPWPDESVNNPPTSEAPDPHGGPRNNDAHNRQLVHFLDTGEIIDVCSDDQVPGCTPN